MSIRTLLIATILCLTAPAAVARAVIVFPKGGGEPIKAHLVRQGPNVVVIAVPQPDGTTVEKVLNREQIDNIHITVSEDRLGALKPDTPQDYRDYAEELAEKWRDPDARVTALRLYLIAAYLDPERLGRSCLLGMADLGRTPSEKRKFRAMVYLLDPDHDTRVLKEVEQAAPEPTRLTPGVREDLVKCLNLLRRDLGAQALRTAMGKELKDQFQNIEHLLSYDEFVKLCDRNDPLTADQLRRTVLAEASLIRVIGGAERLPSAELSSKGASWSQIMATTSPTPAPSLSLETLTEFDPRNCEYRDGEWVKPAAGEDGRE